MTTMISIVGFLLLSCAAVGIYFTRRSFLVLLLPTWRVEPLRFCDELMPTLFVCPA